MASFAATAADFVLPMPALGLLIALGLVPPALSFRGLLARDSGVLRWLALALVLYCGLGAVEVIAAGSVPAVALLFCSLLELALTLMLIRRNGARSRAATTES